MVFPLHDDNSGRRSIPLVNTIIIVVNVLVFVVFQGLGENEKFTYAYSCVPEEIITGKDVETPPRRFLDPETGQPIIDPATGEPAVIPGLERTPIHVYLTIFTAMFMHGGLMHLAGNMWFLWIFGDNVEDDLGPVRYLFFYLLCGVLATLTHVFMNRSGESSMVPSLGASGAISGVLGAYLLRHPQQRVVVIIFRFLTDVPAYVAIGLWFVFQVVSGVFGGGEGGVAYGAHVGGFIAGLALVNLFMIGRDAPPPAYTERPMWR